MPEIQLDRVISVSSEHKNFSAENLLGAATGPKKWKSASAGEKQVSVALQFKNKSKITSIHVGNEGSAFVEVFVGKEVAASDDEWKVILVASSLMTPADARTNTNLNQVRMFHSDSLNKSLLGEKWDRVKVVCTQPFNKSQPYGLSFISFISEEESGESEKSKSTKLGSYTLRDETDSDGVGKATAGSMFSDRARLRREASPPTKVAAAGKATRDSSVKGGTTKDRAPSKPSPAASRQSTAVKRTASPADKEASASKSKRSSSPSSSKPKASAESSRDGSKPVAFKEIFKGVIFSLSGFKNPKRKDLREKAVEMGARFVDAWNKDCTHLVCAFASTPKFIQVDGKGYIITEDWIHSSHNQKKKLPWRDFRLGRAKSPVGMKDDEKETPETSSSSKSPKSALKKDEDKYSGSTDVSSDGENSERVDKMEATQVDSDATEIDTDDEIAAHLAEDTTASKGKAPVSGKAPVVKQSNGTTETRRKTLPVLPDYLLDKSFLLYGNTADRHSVYRYIHAYGGQVIEYMSDEVQYVITDDSWDENFDSALGDNDQLIFVKSRWIMDIHRLQKFIPYQKYSIVPQ